VVRPPAQGRLRGALRVVGEPRTQSDARQQDVEIIHALQRGEDGAFRMLWDRHSQRIYRILERALGPGEDVDDLTQEVFIRVFGKVAGIREPAALAEFVVSVATRVLKWELRRRWVRRWTTLSTTGDLPELPDSTSDPEARQALRRCYRILDGLNGRERTAFVLRFVEEMTINEVAASLGVSISTAKRLVNRAAEKIARQVGEDRDLRLFFMAAEGRTNDAR
jgi:RNA polymerase sigma-70 factor (ECF subfamily)